MGYLRKALTLSQFFIVPLVHESASAARIEEQVRNYDAEFIVGLVNSSWGRPSPERLELIRMACVLLPQSGRARLEEAFLAAQNGKRQQALQALGAAQALGLDAETRARAGALRKSLLEGALSSEGDALIDRASEHARLGSRKEAVAALERAMGLRLTEKQQMAVARIYSRLGDWPRALAALQALTRSRPEAPGVWIILAETACEAREEGVADAAMAKALRLSLTTEDRHRIALVHQSLRHYDKAADILTKLAAENPKSAVFFNDLGVCFFLAGRRDDARKNFRRALELDPGLLSARKSLAVLGGAP